PANYQQMIFHFVQEHCRNNDPTAGTSLLERLLCVGLAKGLCHAKPLERVWTITEEEEGIPCLFGTWTVSYNHRYGRLHWSERPSPLRLSPRTTGAGPRTRCRTCSTCRWCWERPASACGAVSSRGSWLGCSAAR